MAYTHPFPGASVTTRFGAPAAAGGGIHTGTDYAYSGSSCGRIVRAIADGTARRATNLGGGNGVLIDHGGLVESGYWHLTTQLVANGQRVRAGQAIGTAGASGTLVRGCHLHLEIKVKGANVDPEPFLAGAAVVTTPDRISVQPGESCPPGYVKDPSGPNRCISTTAPGVVDARDVPGAIVGAALGAALPVAANGLVIIVALVLGWNGVKQVLGVR